MPDEILNGSISMLQNDFNQSYEQSRHYDNQIIDIFKYLATFYTTIIGIAVGIDKYALTKFIDLSNSVILGLSVSLLFGTIMYYMIVRNRIYFVVCMRFINEQRNTYLSYKPLSFENKSGMYTNHNKPPFFNFFSSQSFLMYLIAFMNSCLLFAILYFAKTSSLLNTVFSSLFLLTQLSTAIIYLMTRENKSASKAVFGK